MKFQKMFLVLALLILLVSLVSAVRYEDNFFRYGSISPEGDFSPTTNPISDVSVLGVICANSDCSEISGYLWNGDTLNSGDDKITLEYPTVLQSQHGYGIYMFKEGYIPYEVAADWSGTSSNDPVGPFDNYLSKKTVCTSPISSLEVSNSGNSISINFDITSPIESAGPLNYIPSELSSLYSVDNLVDIVISGPSNKELTTTINTGYSETKSISYDFDLSPGSYSVSVSSTSDDSQCLSSDTSTKTSSFTVEDTTPPSPISNLILQNRTNTTLKWTWNNPSDSDYAFTQIFLDNQLVSESSNNMYEATSLQPNTTYTISLKTVDSSGNVNDNAIVGVGTTLANDNTGNPGNQTDTTPPAPVSSLSVSNKNQNSILWTWNNPSDSDFSKVIIFINGVNVANTSSEFYNAQNLNSNTTYTISLKTVDSSGNINENAVEDTTITLPNTTPENQTDITPPSQVSNLVVADKGTDFILWTWNNPSDSDFSMSIIFLDGINIANSSDDFYQAVNLDEDTEYTLTILTKDLSENVNTAGISSTTKTLEENSGEDDDSDDDPKDNSDNDSDRDSNTKDNELYYISQYSYNDSIILGSTSEDFPGNPITLKTKKSESEFSVARWAIILILLLAILVMIIIISVSLSKNG